MKAKLEFSLPEEREEHEDAINGSKYKHQLGEIWDKVFRPRHKHGYSDEKIDEFMRSNLGQYVMDELEKRYREATED